MITRNTIGFLVALIVCSCVQKQSKKGHQIKDGSNQHLDLSSVLKIENRINRGARYTDSDSTSYWLIHIASTITNESTAPIQLSLAFSDEYYYPIEFGDQKFKIFILPKVFALDSVRKVTDSANYTDSVQAEILDYLENGINNPYKLNKNILPGERCVIPIGTQYSESSNCGVFPNLLLSQSDLSNFQTCDILLVDDESIRDQLTLGLKLDFRPKKNTEKCRIVQCGQIGYSEE